mmetsp:Transcript_3102/g.4966  ORF Transcript_3102/g.4966 Transcript_3102/m.4966 type:complete len:205 (+) Transcript_3102:184-798(+)
MIQKTSCISFHCSINNIIIINSKHIRSNAFAFVFLLALVTQRITNQFANVFEQQLVRTDALREKRAPLVNRRALHLNAMHFLFHVAIAHFHRLIAPERLHSHRRVHGAAMALLHATGARRLSAFFANRRRIVAHSTAMRAQSMPPFAFARSQHQRHAVAPCRAAVRLQSGSDAGQRRRASQAAMQCGARLFDAILRRLRTTFQL